MPGGAYVWCIRVGSRYVSVSADTDTGVSEKNLAVYLILKKKISAVSVSEKIISALSVSEKKEYHVYLYLKNMYLYLKDFFFLKNLNLYSKVNRGCFTKRLTMLITSAC